MKKSILIIILGLVSCIKHEETYLTNTNQNPNLADIIKFTKVPATTVEADSFHAATLEVKIDPDILEVYKSITFHTTGGVFDNNDTIKTIHANYQGYASVPLKSRKDGTFKITASVSKYLIDTTVTFVPALPEYIDRLFSDKFTDNTLATFTITTKLGRDPRHGLITEPVEVIYNITPDNILLYQRKVYSKNNEAVLTVTNPRKVSGAFTVSSTVQIAGTPSPETQSIPIDIKP